MCNRTCVIATTENLTKPSFSFDGRFIISAGIIVKSFFRNVIISVNF